MPPELPRDDGEGLAALGRRLAQHRKAAGHTQQTLGPLVFAGRSTIANVEAGRQRVRREFWKRCDELLHSGGALTADYDRLAGSEHRELARLPDANPKPEKTPAYAEDRPDPGPVSVLAAQADVVRHRIDRALGRSEVSASSLDDWDRTSAEHARATRHRSPQEQLAELLDDVAGLDLLHERRHTASSLRRTTMLTARMAGLVSLTMLKLNRHGPARQWGHTARQAAAEAGDPATNAWVWAQEAFRFFYGGDLLEAIGAARRAQHLAGHNAHVGSALAAALQARAYAVIGDAAQTRLALAKAEDVLDRLGAHAVIASAFGYDEAQLRFHAGNAYTHLGDVEAAWAAQDRALTLYLQANYLDRALIGLDRADCLIRRGDVGQGCKQLSTVFTALTPSQTRRARFRTGVRDHQQCSPRAPGPACRHSSSRNTSHPQPHRRSQP
jgi:tetratricopeptide (TPR) repeat protein